MIRFVLILFLCLPVWCRGATVAISFTNSVMQPDTNLVQFFKLAKPVLANGGIQTLGPAVMSYPGTNGWTTNVFAQGPWLATNAFLAQGIIFAVPQGNASYVMGVNLQPISGFNLFNYTPGVNVITSTNNSVNIVSSQYGVWDLSLSNVTVGFSPLAGLATNAQHSADATNAVSAGSATNSVNAQFATNATSSASATNAVSSGSATNAVYAGLATNAINSAFATNAQFAALATNSLLSASATNAQFAAMATNAVSAGMATNASYAGIATNALNAPTATNAVFASLATNALNAAMATNAVSAGIATNAINSATATNAVSSSSATNSSFAGLATNAISSATATNSFFAGTATNAISSGTATNAINAGLATNATFSATATNAISSGMATNAINAGLATNAITASFATNATYATTATNVLNAPTATNAVFSSVATNAYFAGTATNSYFAGTATNAYFAGTATNAVNAGLATNATFASTATNSYFAGTATNAINAGIATNGAASGFFTSSDTNSGALQTASLVVTGTGNIVALTTTGETNSGNIQTASENVTGTLTANLVTATVDGSNVIHAVQTATVANALSTGSVGTNNTLYGDQYRTNALNVTTGGVTESNAVGSVVQSAGNIIASGNLTIGTNGIITGANGPMNLGGTPSLPASIVSGPNPAITIGNGSFTASTTVTQTDVLIAGQINQSGTAGFSMVTIAPTISSFGTGPQDLLQFGAGAAYGNFDKSGNFTNQGKASAIGGYYGALHGVADYSTLATNSTFAAGASNLLNGAQGTNVTFWINGTPSASPGFIINYSSGLNAFEILTNGDFSFNDNFGNPILDYSGGPSAGDVTTISRDANVMLQGDGNSTRLYDQANLLKLTLNSNLVTIATNTIVQGSLGYQMLTASKVANYSVLIGDSGTVFNNNGSTIPTTNNLPASQVGLLYGLSCYVGQTVAFKAIGADTIRSVGTVSPGGGYIYSSTIGSTLLLYCQAPGTWYVYTAYGTWNLQTASGVQTISDPLSPTNNFGTAGWVLTTDGAGNSYWAVSTGSGGNATNTQFNPVLSVTNANSLFVIQPNGTNISLYGVTTNLAGAFTQTNSIVLNSVLTTNIWSIQNQANQTVISQNTNASIYFWTNSAWIDYLGNVYGLSFQGLVDASNILSGTIANARLPLLASVYPQAQTNMYGVTPGMWRIDVTPTGPYGPLYTNDALFTSWTNVTPGTTSKSLQGVGLSRPMWQLTVGANNDLFATFPFPSNAVPYGSLMAQVTLLGATNVTPKNATNVVTFGGSTFGNTTILTNMATNSIAGGLTNPWVSIVQSQGCVPISGNPTNGEPITIEITTMGAQAGWTATNLEWISSVSFWGLPQPNLGTQDFETQVIPTGWTTDALNPFYGYYPSLLGNSSLGLTNGANAYFSFSSATNEVYFHGVFNNTNAQNLALMRLWSSSSFSTYGYILAIASGKLNITDLGGANTASTTTSMAANTVYYIWGHYKAGTGANAILSCSFNTLPVEPTSGNNFAQISNGASVSAVGTPYFYGGASDIHVWDHLGFATFDMPNGW